MYFDNELDYAEATYLHFGFMVRPRISFEFGLFIGGALGGTIWTDTDPDEISGYWGFPANFNVWVLYKLNEQISIRVKYLGVEIGGFGDELVNSTWPISDDEFISGKLSVSALYSFTVGGPGARRRPRR
jgi:hypothetical protein